MTSPPSRREASIFGAGTLLSCYLQRLDVYQLAHDQAVAPFGKSAREWVWMDIFGVGASKTPRLIEPTQSEFLSVFTSAHLADARQCFGVRQRESWRVEHEV